MRDDNTPTKLLQKRDEIRASYARDGFISFPDLLSDSEVHDLQAAFDRAEAAGKLSIGEDKVISVNDVIYIDPVFEKLAKDTRFITILQALLGDEVELQHSKFINKPRADKGGGVFKWHQDFPFFPHTNFDLLALAVHLDEENADSGPLQVIPGSHQAGVLSHCVNGEFVYHCTDTAYEANAHKKVTLTGRAGNVTIHHCLTMHASDQKRNDRNRRVLYYQVRARDCIQLAGPLWKCTGYQLTPYDPKRSRMARLADGISIEIRGNNGRLFDIYGALKPDGGTGRTINSY